MWRLVLTVVLWNTISSQPVTDESQVGRASRQVDFIECCPCPGSSRAGVHGLAPAARPDDLPRAAAVDDCPCRVRDADSEGSPSLFFPRAERPVRPLLMPESSKEDVKPLLKPEVGLASSMLETLREVTDEEYQDALDRDAARNAARVADLADAQPDTANNVLTIIVNPIEDELRDAVPEATQSVETHCNPEANLEQVRDAEKGPVFKLSPRFFDRSSDMDSGASSIQESVVGLNKGLEGLRLKTTPSLLKLFPPRKAEGGNIQSLLKLKDNKIPKNSESQNKLDSLQLKLPLLKLPSLLRKNEDSSSLRPLGLHIQKFNIPKTRPSLARKTKVTGNDDSKTSPSIIQEQVSLPEENGNTPIFNLKSILTPKDNAKNTLDLNNLLNLKDVEIIKPSKIILPKLNLFPTLRLNHPDKRRKTARLNKNCNTAGKQIEEHTNERDSSIHTTILDAIPHSSDSRPVVAVNDINPTNFAKEEKNIVQDNKNIETEIIDALPGASENIDIVVSHQENFTPSLSEENIGFDGGLETGQFEETEIDATSKLPKDNVKNIDPNDNSLELTINGDENSQSKELEVVQENDQPFNEIEISGSPLLTEDRGLDLEIEQFDANDGLPTFTFSTDDGESIFIEEDNQGSNAFGFETSQNNPEITEFDIEPVQESDESDIFFRQFLHEDKDVTAAASNQDIHTILTEQLEDRNVFSEDSLKARNLSVPTEIDADSVSMTDFLASLKERISSKLNTLKNNDENLSISSRKIEAEAKEIPFENNPKKSLNSDETTVVEPLNEDTGNLLIEEKAAEMSSISINSPVDMHDLQQLSNSILKQSERGTASKVNNCEILKEENKVRGSFDNEFQLENETSSIEESNNEENEQTNQDIVFSAASSAENVDNNDDDSHSDFVQDTESSNEFIDNNANSEFAINNEVLNAKSNFDNSGLLPDDSSSADNKMKSLVSNLPSTDDSEMISAASETVFETSGNSNKNDALDTESSTDKSCPSSLSKVTSVSDDKMKKSASNLPNPGESEMTSAASETFFETSPLLNLANIPNTPLLQQSIVVQPPSLFPPLAPIDLSSVTLPTLDDIRMGISNILGGNPSRAAEEEEIDSDDDCFQTDPTMFPDASTTNTKSVFSPLKTLEDINLDIFQVNPQSQGSPLLSKIPSLNLNSFKTKLALPKLALLKPINLQSALGSKSGGLLGASLTFGPDKIASGSEMKPIINLDSILNRHGSNKLGSALTNLPSVEELRSIMRVNANSLLKSPLVSPLTNTLRTTESIGDSLRTHTENTMKNIQKSLSSARVGNAASSKFAKPQDLLEMVSSAHEDVKDKLYGIHVDLQDRLSSFHDSILDKSKFQIPTLQSPLLSTLGLHDNFPSRSTARNNMKKTPSPKLIVSKKKSTARPNKPIGKPKELNKAQPFKLSKAASSLSPKTVEVPKLMASSTQPPFLRPLQRDYSLKLKEASPIFSSDQRQITNNNKLKPFGIQTKVTIATTPRPTSARLPTRVRNKGGNQFESFRDSSGFASEPPISKLAANVKPPTSRPQSVRLGSEIKQTLRPNSPLPSSGTLPEFSLTNPLKSSSNLPNLKTPKKLISLKSTLSPVTLPKPTESPLVSKMREAIRIRFSRPANKLKPENLGKPQIEDDMRKSASENKDVVIKTEPMKENVSYKCKMVCVREQ